MEIIVGKYSGFCLGVKTTIDLTNKVLKDKKAYCIGQIIHNDEVIKDLTNKGLITVDNINEIPNNSRLIIRAHGVSKNIYDLAKDKNLEIFDFTCGKIKVIHKNILDKKDNYFIIIIGKKNHPEVIGSLGFAGKYSYVIEDDDDIKKCAKFYKESGLKKVYVTSQTTFSLKKFDDLVDTLKKEIVSEYIIDKKVCDATEKRQTETQKLANSVDCMIIIGGKNSSNTKELYNIAVKSCPKVYLIETIKDLKDFNKACKVGIMSGASTPDNVTKEVIDYLKTL